MADLRDNSTLENSDVEESPSGCHVSKKIILAIAIPVSIVVILAIILGLVFGLKKKNANEVNKDIFIPEYKTITSASYYSEVIGTVNAYKPVKGIHNEGNSENYPKYGYTLREVIGTEADKVEKSRPFTF